MTKGNNPTEVLDVLVGSCGFFKVVSLVKGEAFLNCGLGKDLFVPKSEQLDPMRVGQSYVVFVYRDEHNGRITGSSKLHKYLYVDAPDEVKEKDEVDLLVYGKTALGYKAVVGKDAWGILYKNEVFKELRVGQKFKGYIKKIRTDGRIDLSLERPGFRDRPDLSAAIINYLKDKGASSALSDKTPAEDIYRLFGVSKKKFKMEVGMLYKDRKVNIVEGRIFIVA